MSFTRAEPTGRYSPPELRYSSVPPLSRSPAVPMATVPVKVPSEALMGASAESPEFLTESVPESSLSLVVPMSSGLSIPLKSTVATFPSIVTLLAGMTMVLTLPMAEPSELCTFTDIFPSCVPERSA